jgi:hypothetical protein
MTDDEYDDEDLYDAVIDFRKNHPWCEVCDKCVKFESCDHPKNGYCSLFRIQAEKDKVSYNMHEKSEKL